MCYLEQLNMSHCFHMHIQLGMKHTVCLSKCCVYCTRHVALCTKALEPQTMACQATPAGIVVIVVTLVGFKVLSQLLLAG